MLSNLLNKEISGKVLLAVWLNFPENGKHGCSKACYFCNFRTNPICMFPSEEDLREFIADYMKYSPNRSILLSGGGDPLFNFKKNREKIEMILRVCKELKVEVVLQSGELGVIKEEFDSLFKDINVYYFSSEEENEELHDLAATLLAAKKRVVITKVFNSSADVESVDYGSIDSWVNYYKGVCTAMWLRENYNERFTDEQNVDLALTIRRKYAEDSKPLVRYRPHKDAIDRFIGLMNDTVMWGHDFIFLNKNK